MLYNKDWNKAKVAPKTDPMSLDGLIAWLETKDPRESYCFHNTSRCLVAQWAQSFDPTAKSVPEYSNSWIYLINGQRVDFQDTKLPRLAVNTGSTFGEALEKAKTYRGRK